MTLTSGAGSGNVYNVGTEVDSVMYNAVVQWYNEDGENGTLPTASPGTPPKSAGSDEFSSSLKVLRATALVGLGDSGHNGSSTNVLLQDVNIGLSVQPKCIMSS